MGAAVVIDPDGHGPGIITERDILRSVGAGQDPDGELVAEHLTSDVVYAAPDWSLEEAAAAMVRGGFRHLIVVEARGDRRHPLRSRHRALLDRRRGDLSRCRRARGEVRDLKWREGPSGSRAGGNRAAPPLRSARAEARRSRGGCLRSSGPRRPTVEDHADDGQLDERGDAHERQRDADRGEQRQQARAGEVDLLADRAGSRGRAGSRDVDGGDDEGEAEHEHADRARRSGRCGCSCGRGGGSS